MEYFNTFGGNPVSCAAGARGARRDRGRAACRRTRARLGGAHHGGPARAGGAPRAASATCAARGLFLGVELTGARRGDRGRRGARARAGVLLSTDGPRHNVLKIKPPLAIGDADAELLLRTLDAALYDASRFSIR